MMLDHVEVYKIAFVLFQCLAKLMLQLWQIYCTYPFFCLFMLSEHSILS